MLQVAGQCPGIGQQLRVAQRAVEKDDGRLVRKAPRGQGEVVGQRHLRHLDLARQALGPDGVPGWDESLGHGFGFRDGCLPGMLGGALPPAYLYLRKRAFRRGERHAAQLSSARAMISFITSLAPP
ncbi:hypothetical protein D3C72_1987960 [compost metagenome]